MSTRVYVPSTWSGLRAIVLADGVGPPPLAGHAVTGALRDGYAEGGEEEWEYAAMAAAARASLGLLTAEDEPRRVVVALDADTVLPVGTDDPTTVEVGEAVPFRRIAAVLVDTPDAGEQVGAAAAAWAAAEAGDPDAEALVERCLDRDLAWYATQEVGDLLLD